MGATNCPETPRQKMIGMMYLVLTAMLALNVSTDILNSFGVVDETLKVSTKNVEGKVSKDYAFIEKQKALLGEAKVKDAADKAYKLRKLSDDMVNYIEKMKDDMLDYTDGGHLDDKGQPKTVRTMKAKDNFDKPTDFMINKGHAKELKAKIKQYKEEALKLVDPKNRESVKAALGLEVDGEYKNAEGAKESWEDHNFFHIVNAAAVTLLNKTVQEVRNAESTCMNDIISSISADDFKFDSVTGKAIPKSQMVFSGDHYQADIIVAAFDSKTNITAYYKMGADTLTESEIGGAQELIGEGGICKLDLPAGGVGEQKYAGLIKLKAPDGTDKFYSFKDKYTIVKPTATVAAEKMNVLYAAIPNPVSVSAPVAPEKLRVSFPGASAASKGAGLYDVTVPESMAGKSINVTVSADLGGKTQALGSTTFRVKRVPNPTSYIGASIWGGKRSKQELLANPFISARMGEDFAYDLSWKVLSYRVTFVVRGVEDPPIAVAGGQFSDAVRSKINSASSNTTIQFTDIKVSSIAGTRTLRDIMVRIR